MGFTAYAIHLGLVLAIFLILAIVRGVEPQ